MRVLLYPAHRLTSLEAAAVHSVRRRGQEPYAFASGIDDFGQPCDYPAWMFEASELLALKDRLTVLGLAP